MASVRLPVDIDNKLSHLATLTKRSKSFYIKEALEQYLEDMEDMLIALQRIKKSNPAYYSTAEVLARLNARED